MSFFRETVEKDLAEWEKRDPLKRIADWLIGRGLASARDLERAKQDEEERIEEAFKHVLAETAQ